MLSIQILFWTAKFKNAIYNRHLDSLKKVFDAFDIYKLFIAR